MPTFTSGDDIFTISAAGTYSLDMLGGNDRLNVYGGTNVTAHLGDGNDLAIVKAAIVSIFGDAGLDRFDIYSSNATVDGGADSDTINVRGGSSLSAHGGLDDDRFNFYADASSVMLYGDDANDDFYGYEHQISGTLNGGLGSDYFNGFVLGATLAGGAGNDIYRVTANGDPATFVENAGEGIDFVQLARGQDYTLPDNIENISIQGFSGSTTGAAQIVGNALGNSIVAHNNDETIYGLDGNDNLSGKGGNDTLWGGSGRDLLDGGTGDDQLTGDAGDDTLQGRGGDDSMAGGPGDDVYYVDSFNDSVYEAAGEGTDTVRVSADYFLRVDSSIEIAIIQDVGVGLRLDGNSYDNLLIGNQWDDTIFDFTGNDTLKGGAGNDTLNGGSDQYSVASAPDNDTLYGGSGNDTLSGGNASSDDRLFGGTGDDVYWIYAMADVEENADEGIDTVWVNHVSNYSLPENVENGYLNDDVDGLALSGNGLANILAGRNGDDILNGGAGNDTLTGGGQGADTLIGGAGNDSLSGDTGADTLIGGSGADTLTGGAASDTFQFGMASDSIAGALDIITDFTSGSIKGIDNYTLDLHFIDANTLVGGDQAFTYIGSNAFTHSAGELRAVSGKDGTSYHLYGDVNGDAVADFELSIHVTGLGLYVNDIVL